METRIWFDAKLVLGGSSHFSTENEARDYITDASNGFPLTHPSMTLENREYWKKCGKEMVVVKVTQTYAI